MWKNCPTATTAQFLPVNIHKNRYLLLSIRLKFFLPQKISFALRDVSFLPELPSMVWWWWWWWWWWCGVMWAFCQNCHQWCVADASLIRHQRICWRSDMLALRLEERVNKVLFTCKTPLSSLTSCRDFCKFSISTGTKVNLLGCPNVTGSGGMSNLSSD